MYCSVIKTLKMFYLYALCWRLQSSDEALSITGGHISNIHMPFLEPGGDWENPPAWVCPYVCGAFQEIWEFPRKIQVNLSGHSQLENLNKKKENRALSHFHWVKKFLFSCVTCSTSSSNVEISSWRKWREPVVKRVADSASNLVGGGDSSMLHGFTSVLVRG